MKKLTFALIFLLGCCFVHAQSIIDPALQREMNQRGDSERIKIVVLMKAQYDRSQLNSRAAQFTLRAERRDFVVEELKAFAERSQHDIRQALSEMEEQGLTSTPKMLWMSNSLYFEANKKAIGILAQRHDLATIGFDKKHKGLYDDVVQSVPAAREITPNVLKVNADKVWELGYTGKDVVVAVIDEGANYNHLDLKDHLWDGGDEFPLHGYDVCYDDNDPMDENGHGSHTAGTVLGDGSAGSQTGIAPDATLMIVKGCSNNEANATNMVHGIEWAVEHRCDIFSMSLGVAGAEIAEKELFRRTCVAALDAGIAGAVCAGNEGMAMLQMLYPVPNNVRVPAACPPPYLDPDQLENPGGLSCVIAVGAVDDNDVDAYFTSEGPVTWQNTEFGDYPYDPGIGLIRPDVCAPGVQIKSLDYLSNDGYTFMDGTSQATPCVAGIMALMLSKNPNLMPADLCRILEESSVKLTEHKDNRTGVGRVDALAAIEMVPTWDAVSETTEGQAQVFPNPTNGTFTVTCEGMNRIEVYSIDGRLVNDINVTADSYRLEGLANGIYVLQVTKDSEKIIQKIIKY